MYCSSNFPGYTSNYVKLLSYQKMKRSWVLKCSHSVNFCLPQLSLVTGSVIISSVQRPLSPQQVLIGGEALWLGRSRAAPGRHASTYPVCGQRGEEGGKTTPQGYEVTAFPESLLTWPPYLDFHLYSLRSIWVSVFCFYFCFFCWPSIQSTACLALVCCFSRRAISCPLHC